MIARVATFTALPKELDGEAVALLRQTVRTAPGFVAGFHLVDPDTGRALSITIHEDKAALQRAAHALASRPADAKLGIDPETVELFEATQF